VPPGDVDLHPAPFPLGYLTPPVDEAFDHFWNSPTLKQAYANAWRQMAARLRAHRWLIGYDLINEPFPGSDYARCLAPSGCPDIDAERIEPAEQAAAIAIRAVDREHPVLFEPNIFFDWGQPSGLVAPGDAVGSRGLSFHDECPERAAWEGSGELAQPTPAQEAVCLRQSAAPIEHAAATSARIGAPAFMTELDPITNSDPYGLECILKEADRAQLSWTYGLDWRHGELRQLDPTKAAVLARAYPVAVAGTPIFYTFDPRTGVFRLAYRTSAPGLRRGVPTVVELPVAEQYPNGYRVHVEGAAVVSPPSASRLLLENLPGATVVRVVVEPVGNPTSAARNLPPCPMPSSEIEASSQGER
jgi:endoglycosylceramidase